MTIVIIIIVVLVLIGIGMYNRLIRLRVQAQEAWADIDVQLKRRYDLIPNLVETVKGYAHHEQETFQKVVEARSKATSLHIDASSASSEEMSLLAGAQTDLVGSLGKLLAVAEGYPDLKADQNFLELQRELSDTENKLQAARRFYNTTVRDFRIAIHSFPVNLVASSLGFKERAFFELPVDSSEREAVEVNFETEA